MEGDVPFAPPKIHSWNWGRPFTVRTPQGVDDYPANAAWRHEDDGRLRVGGTIDQEHFRLNTDRDELPIAETGHIQYIGREYMPGEWTMEQGLPE